MAGSLEYDRLLAEVERLRRDVAAARQPDRSGRIPIFEKDPDVETGLNFWMMYDGRLRGRLPDGTVVEWAAADHDHPAHTHPAHTHPPHTHPGVAEATTPSANVGSTTSGKGTKGGDTSTKAPPPPKYVPSTRRYKRSLAWAQSYNRHGQRSTSDLFYGNSGDSWNGQQQSMIGFSGLSELAPGPAGTRITEVWLTLTNRHTWNNSGGTLRLGLHDNGSKPGSFQENYWRPIEVKVYKEGTNKGPLTQRYRLPNWVGERMRDGRAQGFTLNQRSNDRAFYGYARASATLEIIYVK